MSIVKNISRSIIFPGLVALGAERVLSAISGKNNLVLMFHGVTKEDTTWFSPRHLPLEHFDKLIAYIKSNFLVCNLDQFVDDSFSSSGKRKVLITFDDGYVNNLKHILPVMQKYEAHGLYFVSTLSQRQDHLNVLWADIVTAVNFYKKNEILIFGQREFKNGLSIDSGTNLFDFIKKMNPTERDSSLIDFSVRYGVEEIFRKIDSDIWQLMSKEELLMFASSEYVAIGSHGHMHYNLGQIDLDTAKKDMLESKMILQGIIGKPVDTIAFPDGSYNSDVKDAAAELGFKYQFAVNYLSQDDLGDSRIFNRYGISSTTTLEANKLHVNNAFRVKGFN